MHHNSLPPSFGQFHDNSQPSSSQLHHNSLPLSSNALPPLSGQLHRNPRPRSSFLHTPIRPSFLSTIRQNSSSSSSSSSSYSTHSQSQTTSYEPDFHQSSAISSPSLLDHEGVDEEELKLLKEVEIIDEDGNIIRQEQMRTKHVFKLREGEKILVHVDELDQPIKAGGGLCTRFMTLLLKEPNLCPPDAKSWTECKISCGVMLLLELRRRFHLPQRGNVDTVLLDIFGEKFRSLKYTLKMRLFKLATKKLDDIGENGVLKRQYTEEELLDALDLVEAPKNFKNHEWELYKNTLRAPTAQKLSQYGKKARASKLHDHTTGAVSFARKKYEFKVINKREANQVEFFDSSHLTKSGSYVKVASRELMYRAREEISKKISEAGVSEPIDAERYSELERAVMRELRGPRKHGRPPGYGAGVRRSQVTQFSFHLRKVRGEYLANENRHLLDKVDNQSKQIECQKKQIETQSKQIESQSKQIESQSKQMSIMEQKIDECTGELRLFRTAFPDIYGARISGTQLSSGALHDQHP